MDAITRFSLKNAAAVVLVAVLITAGGVWSAMQLKKETMPDITIPYVIVTSIYPGAAPSDVYDNVTAPLEKAVRGVSGVKRVSAQSGDSFSVVIAEFGFSQDMEKAEQDVAKVIQPVKLPDGATEPKTGRIGFNSAPILKLAVTTDAKDTEALRSDVRDRIVPALQGVEGVGEAKLAADAPAQIRIELDPDALKDEGLTADGVIQQLQASNLSFPIGAVDLGSSTEPIRVSGTIASIKDLEQFQIAKYPNQGELMGEAFAQIGQGMGALGSAVGALGKGMGQGFSALGSGMGQLGSATGEIGMQAGLINGIQQLQARMYTLKYDTLPQLKAAASAMPTGTPEYAALQGQIAAIETQALPGMQSAINGMQAQITASQQKLLAQRKQMASAGGSSAGLSMGGGGGFKKSSGSSSSTSLKPEITTVELGDVAKITYGPPAGTVGTRANGKQAALIDIVKTADSNTVDVSDGVHKLLPDLEKQLPGGAKFVTVYDAAKGINASIEGMMREGLLGALFAVIVILIFLRNGRATLIAAISIPLSVVTAMVLLKQIGVTLNIMTLGGLTVAIGRVVDDSIVVIENIFRHLQRGDARTPETIRAAASEVTGAITSSTLTTVAVFLPLGLVTGVIGKIFLPFALTVALSLLASLLVAVTIAPLMAKWMLLGAKVPKEQGEGRIMGAYRKVLNWSLDHRWAILGGAFALFIGSLALVPVIGTGFVPENKEKYVNVEVTYPEGTKATVVDGAVKQIEKLIVADKNVALYEATIGGSNDFSTMRGGSGGSNTAALMIRLSDDADTEALLTKLRKESLPLEKGGAQIVYSRVDASGTNSELEVMVTGNSIADIRAASDAIVAKLKTMDGLENVKSNLGESRKQLTVDVNQDEAAYYGLNAAMVAGTVRGFVAEQKSGSIKLAGKPTDVVYALKLDDIKKATQMRNLELSTPLGDTIQLKKVAAVQETDSPIAVLTRNGAQYAAVSARITERDSGGVIANVKDEIATMGLPKGVETEIGGAAEQMSESFKQLGMAMLIAIGAVYLVMIIAFGEATAPLAIMMSLPLAVVGGLVGLLVAGLPLDIPAMIGALMLIGIVVTNAIVLVDRVQQKRRAGMARRDALVEAGATRMRPILMTAVATVMALAPLASGLAEGALISQGLAVIVIGGLTTSTALTLIVVPVAYDLLEGATERILGKRHDSAASEEPEAA